MNSVFTVLYTNSKYFHIFALIANFKCEYCKSAFYFFSHGWTINLLKLQKFSRWQEFVFNLNVPGNVTVQISCLAALYICVEVLRGVHKIHVCIQNCYIWFYLVYARNKTDWLKFKRIGNIYQLPQCSFMLVPQFKAADIPSKHFAIGQT